MISSIDIIRNQLPVRLSANWQYLGRTINLDSGLKGSSRFAVQIDTGASTIRSSTSTKCASRIGSNSNVIRVRELTPGMVAGCLIDINKEEIAVVDKIDRVMLASGEIQWDLTLDEGVISPYAAETSITLRAFPVMLRRSMNAGDTSVVFDSAFSIIPGDRFFTVSRPELIPVASPLTKIISAKPQMQIYGGIWRWSVETEMNSMSVASDTVLYVEANIGYKSPKLPLPDMSGPYIADVFGGKTFGSTKDDVTIAIEFAGAVNMTSISKQNEVVVSLPVRAGDLALWSFERGHCKVLNQDSIMVMLDSTGCAGLAYEMPIKAPVSLELNFDKSKKVWAEFDDVKTESIESGLFKQSSTCKVVKVCILGVPNDVITVTTNALRLNYRSMSYSYCSRLNPQEAWVGGGLVLKPLMRQLNDLLADSEDGNYLNISNGGLIL